MENFVKERLLTPNKQEISEQEPRTSHKQEDHLINEVQVTESSLK